ncbi:MAG: hypothetical protein QOG03_475 [Actinomycetota bacterium]|jgi:hypothetical protein|nr:hypothetical protein [Actinomycetota bacterium]
MTEDADFKRLVRERMEKTGESFAAARRQLRPNAPDAPDTVAGAPRTEFRIATDATDQQAIDELVAGALDGGMALVDGRLHVWMGDPPSWEAWIPVASVRRAERIADGAPIHQPRWRGQRVTRSASVGSTTVMSRGAHGWRGRWLVNGSGRNLVRLTLGPGVHATVSPGTVIPEDAAERGGRVMRFFFKERTVKLTELVVSVDDPDALVAALGGEM